MTFQNQGSFDFQYAGPGVSRSASWAVVFHVKQHSPQWPSAIALQWCSRGSQNVCTGSADRADVSGHSALDD